MVGFWDCDPGGTAIRASVVERDAERRLVAREPEVELEASSVIGAMRFVALPLECVGTGLGCLGAAVGGVKLIAMAWAVGGRLSAAQPPRVAVAAAD